MQVAIEIRDADSTPVTTFEPGMYYYIRSPSYNANVVHAWLHASQGTVAPDATGEMSQTHQQAMNCAQAAYSLSRLTMHSFLWTIDESEVSGECVTLSVAQADSATDAYHTATVRPPNCSLTHLSCHFEGSKPSAEPSLFL